MKLKLISYILTSILTLNLFATYEIGNSKVGVFFTPAEWMPEEVRNSFTAGSGVERLHHRIVEEDAAAFMTTADAYMERIAFAVNPLLYIPMPTQESGLRLLSQGHGLPKQEERDASDFKYQKIYGWLRDRMYIKNSISQNKNLVEDVKLWLGGSFLPLSCSSLESQFNIDPSRVTWTEDPVEAHNNKKTFFTVSRDGNDGTNSVGGYVLFGPLLNDMDRIHPHMESDFYTNYEIIERMRDGLFDWREMFNTLWGNTNLYPKITSRINLKQWEFWNQALAMFDVSYYELDPTESEIESGTAHAYASLEPEEDQLVYLRYIGMSDLRGRWVINPSQVVWTRTELESSFDATNNWSQSITLQYNIPGANCAGDINCGDDIYLSRSKFQYLQEEMAHFQLTEQDICITMYHQEHPFAQIWGSPIIGYLDEIPLENTFGIAGGRIQAESYMIGDKLTGNVRTNGNAITFPCPLAWSSDRVNEVTSWGGLSAGVYPAPHGGERSEDLNKFAYRIMKCQSTGGQGSSGRNLLEARRTLGDKVTTLLSQATGMGSSPEETCKSLVNSVAIQEMTYGSLITGVVEAAVLTGYTIRIKPYRERQTYEPSDYRIYKIDEHGNEEELNISDRGYRIGQWAWNGDIEAELTDDQRESMHSATASGRMRGFHKVNWKWKCLPLVEQ